MASIRTLICSFQLSATGPHFIMVKELLTSSVYFMSNTGFTAKHVNAKLGIFFENGQWRQLVVKTCFVKTGASFVYCKVKKKHLINLWIAVAFVQIYNT